MNTWICTQCGARNGMEARHCWKCGSGADGAPPDPEADTAAGGTLGRRMECLRCPGTAMDFIGRQRFHEGTQAMPFLLGNLGELFVRRKEFDVYACPVCGRVELFLPRIPG